MMLVPLLLAQLLTQLRVLLEVLLLHGAPERDWA